MPLLSLWRRLCGLATSRFTKESFRCCRCFATSYGEGKGEGGRHGIYKRPLLPNIVHAVAVQTCTDIHSDTHSASDGGVSRSQSSSNLRADRAHTFRLYRPCNALGVLTRWTLFGGPATLRDTRNSGRRNLEIRILELWFIRVKLWWLCLPCPV